MNNQTKLKVAAEEIKDILRKHDIAGAIVLHAPGYGENFFHLATSYSCAYIYNDNEVRFYSKKEDYKSPEEQHQKVTDTVNMIEILTPLTGINYMNLETITKMLNEKFDIESTPLRKI